MMRHFYANRRGLFQDDSAPIQKTQELTDEDENDFKLYAMTFTIAKSLPK